MPDSKKLEKVVLGTLVRSDELLGIGDRYPGATVQEEMFDGSNIIRVEPDLLKDELQKEGKTISIEVIPNTLSVFIGIPLSDLSPLDTLASFVDRADHLLSNLLHRPVKLEYRILTNK